MKARISTESKNLLWNYQKLYLQSYHATFVTIFFLELHPTNIFQKSVDFAHYIRKSVDFPLGRTMYL